MASLPSQTVEQPGLPRRSTLAEYFAIDDASGERCEYRAGTVVSMPGGTEPHALITMNLGIAIGLRLRGGACRAYSPDLRIGIPRKTYYMYPDLSVVCGPSELDPRDPGGRTVVNPRLIVEVLSPSTEAYDRGEKFRRYLQIGSVQEYVLVSQDLSRVEAFFRQEQGSWLFTFAGDLDAAIRLRSLDIDVPLAEVYPGVSFPPPSADDVEVSDPLPSP